MLSTQRVGTAAWMAPEILDNTESHRRKQFTEKSDVFSFAMVMYEVLARAIPFEGKRDAHIMKVCFTRTRVLPKLHSTVEVR